MPGMLAWPVTSSCGRSLHGPAQAEKQHHRAQENAHLHDQETEAQ